MKIIGQERVLNLLGRLSCNVLLAGPPGTGKTTLARHYLSRFGRPLELNGGQSGLVEAIAVFRGPILIDEAHRLPVPELIYRFLDEKPGFLQRRRIFAFTTTDTGALPGPLLSRLFPVELDPYRPEDLARIAAIHGAAPEVAALIGRLSRGSPRRAILLAGITAGATTADQANSILNACGWVDGLSPREQQYLAALASGPKSLSSLAHILGTTERSVRLLEAPLVQAGLVIITPRGRSLSG